MPKIVLIRHVTPMIDQTACTARQAQSRLKDYNLTENLQLHETDAFQQSEVYQGLAAIPSLMVSPLPRAQQTARKLFPNRPIQTVDELREFNLRVAQIPLIKLSPTLWFALSRLLWFIGLNPDSASPKQEAARVSRLFPDISAKDNIIVAHGFVLRTIEKQLKSAKFSLSLHDKNSCFSVAVWERD